MSPLGCVPISIGEQFAVYSCARSKRAGQVRGAVAATQRVASAVACVWLSFCS